MTTAFCKQTRTLNFSDALAVVAYIVNGKKNNNNAANKSPNSPHLCQHAVLFRSTDDE